MNVSPCPREDVFMFVVAVQIMNSAPTEKKPSDPSFGWAKLGCL